MDKTEILAFLKDVLGNQPQDWLRFTTHRLDIYDEGRAKAQFVEEFEKLFQAKQSQGDSLQKLPTAYDYVRLGHPLSCVFEWAVAKLSGVSNEQVISFSSCTMPIMAVLRSNALQGKPTRIAYTGSLPVSLDKDVLQKVYGYEPQFEQVQAMADVGAFDGTTIFVAQVDVVGEVQLTQNVDFFVAAQPRRGSVIVANKGAGQELIPAIQHVRRRESIAMTPANCNAALLALANPSAVPALPSAEQVSQFKASVVKSIQGVTGVTSEALVASSGLSMQYAIVMGLIHNAMEKYPGKKIGLMVPPNCYGGTNDQARRVAVAVKQVDVVDLHVDGEHDMVSSMEASLEQLAASDSVPFIIAEIPTNPRVEVPDLQQLQATLSKQRTTAAGQPAVQPVFVLDQTFCPNTPFLGEGEVLSTTPAIAYVSGSKFPSGGKVTAGYCIPNRLATDLLERIQSHLRLCDNEATDFQYEVLAEQLPSMNDRIAGAYANTREFVNYIQETLPQAKINFVSMELASRGFTPSVFSLDLPTKGSTDAEKEAHKRKLNLQLINSMIKQIPEDSKHCVSYGQLRGCYWTIPATSTQGTTKESDKDYIIRVSMSPQLDMAQHKKVFLEFVNSLE